MTVTFPAGPPRIYTASRQLIAGDDFNSLSGHNYSFQTINAVGATQATATPINAANVEVSVSALSVNNGGVLLPPSYPGAEVSILNNSANTTKVYPFGTTDVIQNGATGFAAAQTAITMITGLASVYYCVKKGFWQVSKSTGP